MGLRKAILLILSLILITELSAADMKAEGIGATEKEAYINARENLSSYISYSSYSELNTQDESMSSIAGSSSDIILLSLENGKAKKNKDGTWTAEVIIPSKAAKDYEARINERVKRINDLYDSLLEADDLNTFKRLRSELLDERTDEFIMKELKPSYKAPSLPMSYETSISEYTELLTDRLNTLRQDETVSKALGNNVSSAGSAEARRIENLIAELSGFYDEEINEALLEAYHQGYGIISDSYSDSTRESGAEYILELEAYKKAFAEAKVSAQKIITDIDVKFSADGEKVYNDAINEPLRPFEMSDPEGAREMRMVSAKDEISRLENEYTKDTNVAYEEQLESFSSIIDSATECIDKINGTTYTVDTSSNVLASVKVEAFILETLQWNGETTLLIAGKPVIFHFCIPLSYWLGVDVTASNWVNYNTEIAYWDQMLRDYPTAFISVRLSYSIKTYADTSNYEFTLLDYSVINKSDGTVKYSSREKQIATISFPSKVDFSDLSLESELMDPMSMGYPSNRIREIKSRVDSYTLRNFNEMKKNAAEQAKQEEIKAEEARIAADFRKQEKEAKRSQLAEFQPPVFGIGLNYRIVSTMKGVAYNMLDINVPLVRFHFGESATAASLGLTGSLFGSGDFKDKATYSLRAGGMLTADLDVFFPFSTEAAITLGTKLGFSGRTPIEGGFLDLVLQKPDFSFYMMCDAGIFIDFDSFYMHAGIDLGLVEKNFVIGGSIGVGMALM